MVVGSIDPQAAMKMQPELTSGENLCWAGMPSANVIFHSDDWHAIPFSLLWGGFAIFWETDVLGYWGNGAHATNPLSLFFTVWGVPFVAIGQYLIWGRFFVDGWPKRRTYYAVTNRRVLVLHIAGRGQKTRGWSRFNVGDVPTFADVDDVDSVYRLIVELREQVRKRTTDGPQFLSYPEPERSAPLPCRPL
jgi:hypothetical protein